MSTINTVRSGEDIPDKEELIILIQRQLSTYGGDADFIRIDKAIENSLKEGSRAVFFLWNDFKDRLGAFAFANICSGLESGADYLWINELYVDEMFRKRGVATEILNFINNWAKKNQIVYISCSTGVANLTAQSLYKKSGFDFNTTMWVDKSV